MTTFAQQSGLVCTRSTNRSDDTGVDVATGEMLAAFQGEAQIQFGLRDTEIRGAERVIRLDLLW